MGIRTVIGAVCILALTSAAGLAIAAATAPSADAARRVDLRSKGFALREFKTPVGRLSVYEAGAGQAVVFLHGVYGGASSYASWRKVAPAFVGEYHVVAPDLIGWGASDHPARAVRDVDYVAAITALLTDLKHSDRPAIVVAESLMAGFAGRAAAAHPELVEKLVFITPSGARDFGVDQFKPQVRYTLGALAATPGVNIAVYRAVFHRRATFQSYWEGPGGYERARDVEGDLVDASWWSATRPGAAEAALPFLSGTLRYDIAPILQSLKIPYGAIWGSKDEFLDDATKAKLQAINPAATNITIPLSRGNLNAAKPQEVTAAIKALLSASKPKSQTNATASPRRV